VTSADATAIPVQPLGAYGFPPVGNRTTRDRIAPLLPLQGSRAIGLGRDRYKIRDLNKNILKGNMHYRFDLLLGTQIFPK
jgi:hypothetical protein